VFISANPAVSAPGEEGGSPDPPAEVSSTMTSSVSAITDSSIDWTGCGEAGASVPDN